ncbi:MAG: methionine adenosyltransferase domain-containing protein, partial [Candidatus Eremiobacterota bacterium]
VYRTTVYLTGRIASSGLSACPLEIARAALPDGVPWRVVAEELEVGPLPDAERAARGMADDQNVVVGHAVRGPAMMPPETRIVRAIRRRLESLEPFGPDGKVLIGLLPGPRMAFCNVALQHPEEMRCEDQFRRVLPALEELASELGLVGWSPEVLRLNGAVGFSRAGTFSDNGLSGKKLVVDHYGPGVPIGGGALCGKDPHKVDRAGAGAARQLAVRLVQSGARSATTRLAWAPGQEEPWLVEAMVDGGDGGRWPEATCGCGLSVRGST